MCVQESPKPGTEDALVEDNKCEGLKPATREICESEAKCRPSRYIDNIPKYLLKDVWKQIRDKTSKREVVRLCLADFVFDIKLYLHFVLIY